MTRSRRSPTSINDLLSRRAALSQLTAKIPQQQGWTDWLRVRLPAELAPHLVSVVPKTAELVIFADSAAWSARLRYALVAIEADIARRDATIGRTRVRVQIKSESGT